MNVLILGGAGDMGSGVAGLLAAYPDVSSIVLADLDREAAEQRAAAIHSPKVVALRADALARSALVDLARRFDVVVNAVGPYAHFGTAVLEAVLEAGANYVDLCNDGRVARELLALHKKAKAAGITALICMGSTPGMSNMQAKLAAARLDSVDSLKICWAVCPPENATQNAALPEATGQPAWRALISDSLWAHLVHVAREPAPVWQHGAWGTLPTLQAGEYVDFGPPIGRCAAWYIGHSASATLAGNLRVKDFCGTMGTLSGEAMRRLRRAVDTPEPKDALSPKQGPVWQPPFLWDGYDIWCAQAAIAEGWKNGERKRCTVRVLMAPENSRPYFYAGAAIGAYMVGGGRVPQSGVLAPETCLDTGFFFNELARLYSSGSARTFSTEDVALVEMETL